MTWWWWWWEGGVINGMKKVVMMMTVIVLRGYIDILAYLLAGDAWDVEDGSDRLLVTYGDDADSFDAETQVALLSPNTAAGYR
jgi:hypothetical protein